MKASLGHPPRHRLVQTTLAAVVCCALSAGTAAPWSESGSRARPAGSRDTLRAPVINVGGLRLHTNEDAILVVPLRSSVVSNGVLDSIRVQTGEALVAGVRFETDSLFITPALDSSGAFTLRFYASNEDSSAIADLEGVIAPVTDVRAIGIESNETDSRRPGLIRVYNGDDDLLVEIRSDEAGRFSPVQLPVNSLHYVVHAVITRDGEPFGYNRTLSVELRSMGDDLKLPPIRAIPFDGLYENDVDPETFRNHVLEVTQGRIARWDMDEFAGVFIADRAGNVRFSRTVLDRIKHLWTDPAAVPRFIEGRVLRIVSGSDVSSNAPFTYVDGALRAEKGWIVIAPDMKSDASSSGRVDDFDGDGRYDAGAILLNSSRAEQFGGIDRFITYEAGRVLGMVGRVDPLSFARTVMVTGIGPQVPEAPTFVDEKTGAILYESDFAPLSDVTDLLGLHFYEPAADSLETNRGEP